MKITQTEKQMLKLNEFKTLFLTLNSIEQENIMSILYALEFAQSTMKIMENSGQLSKERTV